MESLLEIFDIYLLEAVVNGILLGGLLALLALGLNLIFGVIDVTWICYAELVMIGMYGMYFLVQYYGVSYFLAAPVAIALVAILGALLHFLVIAPLLSGPPINQLLATGGVLFVLQSFATVAFGIDFRNLGIRLPVLQFAEMHFSYSRLLSFGAAAAFGGNAGGRLNGIADPLIVVPSTVTARIQEMHSLLGHILCAEIEERLGII